MFGKAPCSSNPDTRARLFGGKVLYATYARYAALSEVNVQRYPGAQLEVMAQMTFQRDDGLFGLGLGNRNAERCRVGGVEPRPGVTVE